ncbi:unnamed protein product, partial [Brachionus calyciflorus]
MTQDRLNDVSFQNIEPEEADNINIERLEDIFAK